jgi:hypothetical protein
VGEAKPNASFDGSQKPSIANLVLVAFEVDGPDCAGVRVEFRNTRVGTPGLSVPPVPMLMSG